MPTESELRAALRGGDASGSRSLDAETIIRKARRRRTPKQVVIGSAAAFAVAAVAVVGVNGIPGTMLGGSTSSGSLSDTSMTPESATNGRDTLQSAGKPQTPFAVDTINRCDSPAVTLPAETRPLALTVEIPHDAKADGSTVLGTATLTNSLTERVTATVSAGPSATVAEDGVTRWHSDATPVYAGRLIDLAPAESTTLSVAIDLVACSTADDKEGTSGESLPKLPPGDYRLSVVIELAGMDREAPWLLQSPWIPLTLR